MMLRYLFSTSHNAWGWVYLGEYEGKTYWKLPNGEIGANASR